MRSPAPPAEDAPASAGHQENSKPPLLRPSSARGEKVIQQALRTMPSAPGVYRMLDARSQCLYVGKAKNLRKRVASYAHGSGHAVHTRRMIALTSSVEVVTTDTDAEAVLLEGNLIKRFRPRYNILLRDDKSYPYILLTGDHPWAQMAKHRGARARKGEYFGPFASAGAVNQTLAALQRAFPLRSCSDSVFDSRTRPCLQYQIKRCTAPCCARIGREEYDALVREVRQFLRGRSREVQNRLTRKMLEASEALEFETAARCRDRIQALNQIQAHQGINVSGLGDADVIAVHQEASQSCVQVFFFRSGQNYGNRAYFPSHAEAAEQREVLGAFLGQFYQNKQVPRLLLLSHAPEDPALVERALSRQAGHRVRLQCPARGAKRDLVERALRNAREALARRLLESGSQRRLLERLAETFDLESTPERIEVFDNSHISGTQAVGSMIVVGPEGFVKSCYRKFTIKQAGEGGFTPGDDYGMMREVLTRRFNRLLREAPEVERTGWPDLVLLDGGSGQLNVALEVFADLGITEVALAAIAKGRERNAGRERIHLPGRAPIELEARDPVLYFLQRIRDEAHRFAIGTHRMRRSRALGRSLLDEIPGIGPARKRALLHHFGSAQSVAEATLAGLEQVEGISKTVARTIYNHFREESRTC